MFILALRGSFFQEDDKPILHIHPEQKVQSLVINLWHLWRWVYLPTGIISSVEKQIRSAAFNASARSSGMLHSQYL